MLTRDWRLYDTRHVVYRPAQLKPEALKAGYDWAYREFYRWSSIARASGVSWIFETSGETFLLCGWVEKVRDGVGPFDPHAATDVGNTSAGRGARASSSRVIQSGSGERSCGGSATNIDSDSSGACGRCRTPATADFPDVAGAAACETPCARFADAPHCDARSADRILGFVIET